LANYMREVLFPAGYVEVKTPLVYNKALWERSGHWKHYRENMFLIDSEGETLSVKPMNCPGHFLAYASQVHSYRDLPVRFHEQTPLHRNEASGVLSGLTRVRQFSQDDAHCFVTPEQIGEEVERLIRLVQRVYGDFGLPYTAKLSTRPPEFMGEIATWDHADAQRKDALTRARLAPVQAIVLPISDRHQAYAAAVRDKLAAAGLRVELDDRQEKIGYKIREAQLQKVPYMLVTGDREAAEGTVSVRSRSAGDLGA